MITRRVAMAAAAAIAAALALALAGCGNTAAKNASPGSPAPAKAASGTPTSPAPAPPTAAPTPTRGAASPAARASGGRPPAVSFGAVNRSDPAAVAVAMLKATFTSDTRTDSRPYTAQKRALIWYTPDATAKVLAEAPTGAVGAEWTRWSQHQVTTTVAVSPGHDAGAPADTPTAADRQFMVQVTPHGAGGWTTPPDSYVAFVMLTRPAAAGPWQVASVQVSF